jgi:hypothetical protein
LLPFTEEEISKVKPPEWSQLEVLKAQKEAREEQRKLFSLGSWRPLYEAQIMKTAKSTIPVSQNKLKERTNKLQAARNEVILVEKSKSPEIVTPIEKVEQIDNRESEEASEISVGHSLSRSTPSLRDISKIQHGVASIAEEIIQAQEEFSKLFPGKEIKQHRKALVMLRRVLKLLSKLKGAEGEKEGQSEGSEEKEDSEEKKVQLRKRRKEEGEKKARNPRTFLKEEERIGESPVIHQEAKTQGKDPWEKGEQRGKEEKEKNVVEKKGGRGDAAIKKDGGTQKDILLPEATARSPTSLRIMPSVPPKKKDFDTIIRKASSMVETPVTNISSTQRNEPREEKKEKEKEDRGGGWWSEELEGQDIEDLSGEIIDEDEEIYSEKEKAQKEDKKMKLEVEKKKEPSFETKSTDPAPKSSTPAVSRIGNQARRSAPNTLRGASPTKTTPGRVRGRKRKESSEEGDEEGSPKQTKRRKKSLK